ncbi:MAG: alpha/beta hydrolase [Candidatus Eremiobacteraeota bacterium]|nr:alpha/beta hydrolase [Candidatus Eremiobacteraeota bacterium]
MQASVNGFVAGGHALAERADYRPVLKTVKVPTLILVGVDDALWSLELDQMMHAAIPGSKLVILPGAAHGQHLRKTAGSQQRNPRLGEQLLSAHQPQ